MNSSVGSEIVTGFIEEVEGYLPDMSRCLQTLQQDRAHRPSLAELHRITHTIKGAAAMVGLDDLSGIGEVLEKVMENILGASLALDDETITLLGNATQRIDSYCMMQRAGKPDEGQLFQKTIAEIEEKLCKSTVESCDVEGSSESCNPETILLEESEESIEEEPSITEASPDALDNDLGLAEGFAEEDTDDFFSDAGSLFDETSSPVSPVEEAIDDDLLFQDVAEEEDDLFGSAVMEPSEISEEVPGFGGIEQTGQTDQDNAGAEDIDPELLECFSEETEEHLENIDSCLNTLGRDITDSVELTPSTKETLHSLRRSVHTLKGAAAVIGIEQVAAWGHDFEDFLDWLHDEARRLDPPTIAALRDGADLLASLAEEPTSPTEQRKQRIIAQFEGITEAFSADSARTGRENALDLSKDRAADFFAQDDSEDSEEAANLFDEIALPASSVEEEEDDLFGPAVTEHFDKTPEDTLTSDGAGQITQEDADTEEIDPELLECFSEETEDHLENIDSCLNTLGRDITDSVELTPSTKETLHSLRRSVHTLKGAAAVIGIEQVAAWGHDFEDFLDWLHDEARRLDPPTVAALRDGADLLASLAEEPTSPAEQKKQRIIAQFDGIAEAFSAGSEGTNREYDEDDERDEAENALDLSKDSAADFFAQDDSEDSEEAASLFDEIAPSDSSLEEAREDDLFLQDADEEDDLFGFCCCRTTCVARRF
ncbi:MAG: hypothetical protein D3917_00930 [Candidatus Electrothrix sp. AX5]|nr:hypothetical protein [Candidatus Electrothrix sp. AX5]